MESVKPILILAYGNPSRGDDALGPLLLDNLETLPSEVMQDVECLTDFQLQIEHALDLKNRQLVLFADAVTGQPQPIGFKQLQSAYDNSYTTHAMNPVAVMQVYQKIEAREPPPCFLLSLQGVEFELGATLSPTAIHSLQLATVFVQKLLAQPTLNAWQECISEDRRQMTSSLSSVLCPLSSDRRTQFVSMHLTRLYHYSYSGVTMCGICGCGSSKLAPPQAYHHHHDGEQQTHSERLVRVEQDILAKNNNYAKQNRQYFQQHGIFALNFVSSPGAGKTTLLVSTINALKNTLPIVVIEGDQQTERDADRIRATGITALQINTGKACHLEAHAIGLAVQDLQVPDGSLLAIENVGNLVCPSSFDLGEAHKVVVLSVTEGDDKPIKYPDMFHAADLMIINKIDLLPYTNFDVEQCIAYARQVNPDIEVIQLSATLEQTLTPWIDWINHHSFHNKH